MRKLGSLPLVLLVACVSTGDGPGTRGSEGGGAGPFPAAVEPAGAEAAGYDVPPGDLRGDAARGKELYRVYCSICHGPEGAGDGPTASWMFPRPTNHADRDYMASLSDAHLYTVIQHGGAAVGKSSWMAGWGSALSDQNIRDLIAHVRWLSGT